MWIPCACFAHGALHDRIAGLSTRIAADPRNPQLYLERAELERQHELWQPALADCRKAQRLDPEIETGLLRGRILLESGQPQAALPALEDFLRHHPTHALALTCRARALASLGRDKEALADYRAALQHTPMPEPDLLLEVADALAAAGCPQEAVEVLSAGIRRTGQIPSLVLRALDLEISLHRYDAALGRVEVMRQCAPRPEPWMAKRASILAQAGRTEESRAAWHALVDHLSGLPNLERGSHAMNKLLEEAKQALASLEGLPSVMPPAQTAPSPPVLPVSRP